MQKYQAVLFDMDGVIVDNHIYHEQAWIAFCQRHGMTLTPEDYKQRINGRTITEVIHLLFEADNPTAEEVRAYSLEKEASYREIYGPHLSPTPGLIPFLDRLKAAGIPCAVGTSAPTDNVTFTLDGLGIRPYFQSIIDETGVERGKPDPEIYLRSAKAVGVPPQHCLVLEDALSGIRAGHNAAMGVLALATTHTPAELAEVAPTAIIKDFTELVFEDWFDA